MRTLLSLGLAALLSACAVQTGPRYAPHADASYPFGPMEARILDVNGRLDVWTSRPAYVAIFEIVPGQGVGLLYPAFSEERSYLHGGTHSLWLSRSRSYYSHFLASHPSTDDMPRYLYMIASDAPLRLSRFVRAPGALRSTLGLSRFSAFNPYSVMEDLEALVVPRGSGHEWASDVYVLWPQRRYRGDVTAMDWVRVRCRDGRVIEGPSYYVFDACNTGSRQVPPLAQRPDTTTTGGDSAQVPTRRRPEPEDRGPGEEAIRIVAPDRPMVETIPEVERIRGPEREFPETVERVRVEPRSDTPIPVDGARGEPRIERRPEPRPERTSEPRFERPSPPRVESRPPPRAEPPPRMEAPRTESARPEPPQAR
jgi:hypothetical protein